MPAGVIDPGMTLEDTSRRMGLSGDVVMRRVGLQCRGGIKICAHCRLDLKEFFKKINPVSGKAVRRTNSPSDAPPQVELSLRTRALNLRLDYGPPSERSPGSHSGANPAIRLGLTNSVSMVLIPFIGDKVMFFFRAEEPGGYRMPR